MKQLVSMTFKQFMDCFEGNERREISDLIAKKCFVSVANVRAWTRGDYSPQLWRIKNINNIARKHGYVIKFPKNESAKVKLNKVQPLDETTI